MGVSAGALLKKIREEVFDISIREFSDSLNLHYTTYHNYEKNKFGKSPIKLIYEISSGLSRLLLSNAKAKSKLKDVTVSFFLANCPGLQDCNYLLNGDLTNFDNVMEYIEYSLYLAFNEGHNFQYVESEFNFHSQRRYCINKVLNLSKSLDFLLISHVEDYNIHLQIAKDNSSQKIFYCLEGLTSEIETLISGIATDNEIQNLEFVREDYKIYVKNNKLPAFVFVCYHFHHIQKTQDKLDFLANVYKNLPKGGRLCILDPFFDDYDLNHEKFNNRWSMLVEETEIKKFWTSLKSFDSNSINNAKEFAEKAKNAEKQMGENYIKGINEYLVSLEWVENAIEKIGFKTIIKHRTNCFSDVIFILEK